MQRNSEFTGASQRFQKSSSWKGRSNSHDMTTQSGAAASAGEFVSSKTGYLTKRSIGSIDALANWRERFFVLAEAKLCYYKVGGGFFSKKKEEEQDLAHFKGQLELSPDTVVKKSNIDNKANCFEINTGDKRMFAQANTAKECEDWIKMIRAHVTALQQQRFRKSGSSDESKPTPAQFEASVFASSAATMGGAKANDQDYTRPSLLENHDIVRGAEASTDPKDVVIKQLLEENRQLREQLMLKDQIIHELETSNGQATLQQARDTLVGSSGLGSNRSLPRVGSIVGAPKQMLDLRDLRKKQIQLFDAAEVGNFHLISTLLRDNVIDINGVGINQCTALHLAARNNHAKAVAELPPGRVDPNDVSNKTEMHVTFKNKYHESLALGPRDFEFVKVLGRGAFAKVYLVRGKGANKDKWFALKAYNKQAIVQKNQAQYIHTEKAALQACSDHPYIVSLYYAFQSQDRLFLVMEYCGGGDLLSTLTRRKAFTEPEAAFYIGQIVLALSHLHSKGIVFRDLKPENVVLDLDGNALLTDFGISKEGVADHSSANTFCGSPMYLAPEMLSRSGHGFALDWYSVGALLFELLTGLPPFYTNDKKQLFHNILRGNLTIPEYISPQARDLIQRLLWKDPNQRLGSGPRGDKEIMDHPFFAPIDWNKLYRKEIPPPFKPKIDAGNAVPDTSNFPNSFTEQEITEIERGLAPPPSGAGTLQRSASKEQKESKLFKDFDFTPEVKLDNEAALFEAQLLLHQNSMKNQKPPPLVESDEYSI
ncbi:serine/threonine protein kinase [Saprolegnia parasitica CBS 223.65]|uniref:Serine/threonine protein kinase n=1 Tax=Saprolegnia parasitica (strain CBS 223.65) TaxID=695850 RepID=A0A067CSF0_SAPPC|nr:serine/threonine protein kinase [Saprolegnia parasitica CBS 223.65]KDO33453.1 serine/threonine protein kinase [Saprolegnia parasitica CBS 223.65]|eukprot:XP_012196282.1 serine/threonine protein kinase [Saprolegnia parasitica CBS 223.65]